MKTLRVPNLRPQVRWVKAHRRQLLLYGGGGIVALLLIVQLAYPSDRLLPFAQVDGVNLGGQTKSSATEKLNDAYDNYTLPIYLANDTEPVVSPTLAQADISVDNTSRVNNMDYAWYWRLVPTSLFWAQGFSVGSVPTPTYGDTFETYVDDNLMAECKRDPVDATLKTKGDTLEVVAAKDGSTCSRESVLKMLQAVEPNLTQTYALRVSQKAGSPEVSDMTASQLATELQNRLSNGLSLAVGDETVTVSAADVYAWLDFKANGTTLVATVNSTRAKEWLNANVASKVVVQAGTTTVKTVNFTEVSRTKGVTGVSIDVSATVASLQQAVNGAALSAKVATKTVAPTVKYTRTYSASDAGFNALITNYAKDHSGTFGVSFMELSGQMRRAEYQGDKRFVTASTYKLFAAYELLKQIDAGKRSWSAEETCFNKMITYSDNACAEAYLSSLGLATISKDIQAIGLTNSTFMISGGPFTTANDLATLLGMLQSQQNFSSTNRTRLINAMKANVYRQGIPAGVNGTVADKVGFLYGLLHDAAIVYSPKGTYVLVIMTDGSSWATIADLAKQIDELHSQ